MGTVFRYSLKRYLGAILGWGLSLAVLGAYLVTFYDTLAAPEVRQQLQIIVERMPTQLYAFFGGVEDMFSPAGYLNLEFFSYMPIILGIFVLLAGSDLLSGDEESGKMDLLLAHPVRRSVLFFGRLLAFLIANLAILFIVWLAFSLAALRTSLEIDPGEMALPFLSLFGVLTLFGTLALLLSQLLPSRRMAAMLTGLLLVASFFITSMASLDPELRTINRLSPLKYYQGGKAIQGMEWGWLLGILGISLAFILLAWWRFERRDIRVGGEAGWGLTGLRRKHQDTG